MGEDVESILYKLFQVGLLGVGRDGAGGMAGMAGALSEAVGRARCLHSCRTYKLSPRRFTKTWMPLLSWPATPSHPIPPPHPTPGCQLRPGRCSRGHRVHR